MKESDIPSTFRPEYRLQEQDRRKAERRKDLKQSDFLDYSTEIAYIKDLQNLYREVEMSADLMYKLRRIQYLEDKLRKNGSDIPKCPYKVEPQN